MMGPTNTGKGSLLARIEALGAELRRVLGPLIESIGGAPPRSTRVTRAVGIDKSLASRFVRALRTDSDLELMHIVPSPTGLRILAARVAESAPGGDVRELRAAADRFQELLDATPEGRAAIDAVIAESSQEVRSKREHIAKQASFKSMSFVLGHYCDVLTTALFLVPSPNGRRIDGIEVQRRLGLRRLRPSAPLQLLSFHVPPEDEPEDDSIWVESVEQGLGATTPAAFLSREFSSDPLPELQVVQDDTTINFVLGPAPDNGTPGIITSSFRVRNGWPRDPGPGLLDVRGYLLTEPCRSVVRDLWVAEELLAGCRPEVTFALPTPPTTSAAPPPEPGQPPHFAAVDLGASIEQRPAGSRGLGIPDASDQAAAVRQVLAAAGHAETRFRGWRVRIAYPIPLIEMIWWLDTR
jgi:hypothetical protein